MQIYIVHKAKSEETRPVGSSSPRKILFIQMRQSTIEEYLITCMISWVCGKIPFVSSQKTHVVTSRCLFFKNEQQETEVKWEIKMGK